MTIKQQGGIFGRNPTFNDVDVEGTLTVDGLPVIGGTGTMAAQDANAVAITGGTIEGTVIGGTTAAAVTGTTLTATGAFTSLGIDDNATSTAITIDASQNVGVGTVSPNVRAEISGTDAAISLRVNTANAGVSASNYSEIQLSDNDAVRSYWRNLRDGSGATHFAYADHLAFLSDGGGTPTERVRIDASGHLIAPYGITLGTAVGTYAAANTLDDYEEGLATVTMTPNSSGSITLDSSTNALSYTKVGRLVTLTGFIQVSAVSSPVGSYVTLAGLPFAAAAEGGALKYGSRSGAVLMFSDTTTRATGLLGGGGSGLNFFFDASTVSAPDGFYLNFSYITA